LEKLKLFKKYKTKKNKFKNFIKALINKSLFIKTIAKAMPAN